MSRRAAGHQPRINPAVLEQVTCAGCGKKGYPDRPTAKRKMRELNRTGKAAARLTGVYPCPTGEWKPGQPLWHTTSLPKNRWPR